MDILRELKDEELDYVVEKLKKHLPYSIKNLHYILSAQICRASGIGDLSDKVLPTFYTHRNGVNEHCTIFGITGAADHVIWYFSFDETQKEIRECLENTKRIRWGSQLLFMTIHSEQTQSILDYSAKNNLSVESEANFYYHLPVQEALRFSIEIPAETVLLPLDEHDATLCNSLWKYKSENSEGYIRSLIRVHGGFALRDKCTNELMSFALINDSLAIGMLTTIKKAQGRGYAKVIVKSLAKKMAENGIAPIVFINTMNPVSVKLFCNLGFKRIAGSNWIVVAPPANE